MEKKKKEIRDITLFLFRNWKTLLLIITFDILFVLILSKIWFIQTSLINKFFPLLTSKTTILAYLIIYLVLLFFFFVSIYSFFKYFIINFIHNVFEKVEFNLKNIFLFLKLNLIIFLPLIIISGIILYPLNIFFNNLLLQGNMNPLKVVSYTLIVGVLLSIFFIYIYTLLNILHFSFLEGKKKKKIKKLIKESITKSLKLNYYKIYWNDFKIILIATFFLIIVHFLVKLFIFNDFSSYIRNYGSYKFLINSVIVLVIYFIVLFNRFSFYMKVFNINEKKS